MFFVFRTRQYFYKQDCETQDIVKFMICYFFTYKGIHSFLHKGTVGGNDRIYRIFTDKSNSYPHMFITMWKTL